MRVYKLASLILLAGAWSAACNSSDGAGDGGGIGGGVGAVGNTGGTMTGDGLGGGGGGGGGGGDGDGGHPGCTGTTITATSGSALIDNFDSSSSFPQLPDDDDGRIGSWAHGNWIAPAGADPELIQMGMGGEAPGYLQAECKDETDDDPEGDFAWCNASWDDAKPWQQWASIDLAIAEFSEAVVNCYDASAFTGVKFKARSNAAGNRIRLQINTPDADAETGKTYQGPELELPNGDTWEDFQVPFSKINQPNWSDITAPLDLRALRAISWVVRTRVDQTDAEDMIVGETLAPYNVQIDDVEFY